MNSSILESAEKYMKNLLAQEASGHDYDHCMRVKNLALKIAEDFNCNKNLIALTAVLHDIDDEKIFGANEHENLIEFCRSAGIDLAYQNKILAIINVLSLDKKDSSVPIETKIVQDADNLDALGAIGIARMFAFGGAKRKVMYNGSSDDSLSHF